VESDLDVGDHHRRVQRLELAARPRAASRRRGNGALGTVLRKLELAPLVLAALTLASACGDDDEGSSSPPATPASATTTPAATVPDVPAPVADTWQVILDATESGEYEQLRSVLEKKVFLSDYGFGKNQPDPIERWKGLGPKPLEIMGVLLRMPHAVKETNEGTLYQWPRFDPDSKAEDIEPAEREAFLTIMIEDELVNAFIPEYGYTGPRLGILADGTWWFFLSGGAP
jgi:hypothetical protein